MQEVASDLCGSLQRLLSVNPEALALPPVPLVATFEWRHVLVSTVASQSVLREAAQGLVDRCKHMDYFPNYEIATSQAHQGQYLEPVLRADEQRRRFGLLCEEESLGRPGHDAAR